MKYEAFSSVRSGAVRWVSTVVFFDPAVFSYFIKEEEARPSKNLWCMWLPKQIPILCILGFPTSSFKNYESTQRSMGIIKYKSGRFKCCVL